MEISKYNAEGYYDPTAYEGIRKADADARKFKILYPTGYMELNLTNFFPCTLDKARKIFSLIHKYSSKEDKRRLIHFLQALENEYAIEMMEAAAKAISYPEKSAEYRKSNSRFKEVRRLRQRTARNIELFNAGRVNK
ncbi:hypothetical protein [Oceanobacillus massiliensis]|uniref:hypothetical protein n=1 Tax=Oceanobacillus massiliensis TaxID=1465765 RepID=UPI000289E7FE|nr:hypothetical protein [Oceanobacillus massiliensis]